MAANQSGKTLGGAAHACFHALGNYPSWYNGRRFNEPTQGWVGGITAPTVRDTSQKLLFGDPGQWGTGLIPEDAIIKDSLVNARGVPGAIDSISVKHISGGRSKISFKNYEQGREKWQSSTIHWCDLDEEPPIDLYTEALTRTNVKEGCVWLTFTPLLGMSSVVRRFLNEDSPDRAVINMTIDDVGHYSEEQKKRIIASYPAHEREARLRGIPMLGSGRIFPVTEELITCKPFQIPFTFKRLAGLDFGWDHPTAACKVAYDPETDIVYVTNVYRVRENTPLFHCAALKAWGEDLMFAWPHDGLQHDKGSGLQLAQIYRNNGLRLLPERATFSDGTSGVEAGLMMMLDRMQTGRLKVFDTCTEFFEEFRLYHREEGRVVKEFDDILCACLHPETEVITSNGKEAIVDLLGTEGKILTINGKWADYRNCRVTKRNADLVRVIYSDGHELLCTPDHKLLSNDGTWIQAIDSVGMICHNAISSRGESQCQKLSGIMKRNFTHSTNTTGQDVEHFCTERSGITIMEGSPRDTISTIKTGLSQIIVLIISKCFGENITSLCIKRDTEGVSPKKHILHSKNGERHLLGLSMNMNRAKRMHISCWTQKLRCLAKSVLMNLLPRKMEEIGSALTNASQSGEENLGLMKLQKNVPSANLNLKPVSIRDQQPVPFLAEENYGYPLQKEIPTLQVLRVEQVKGKSDVICLEVPSTSAFAIANGAIVHNCRYALMMLRYAQFQPMDKIRDQIRDKYSMPTRHSVQMEYNPLDPAYIAKDQYNPFRN